QNNGQHVEARANFAAMLRREGDIEGSYSQYLRLAEQRPDHVEALTALSEMALTGQFWDEARRHGARVLELAPDDPATEVIAVNLAYLDAVETEDAVALEGAQARAEALLQADPDNLLLQRLVLDGLVREGANEEAFALLERALATHPADRLLHDVRVQVLVRLDRGDDVLAALREMMDLFPEDESLPPTILQAHLARGEIELARQLLQDVAEGAANDTRRRHEALQALVRFQLEYDGPEAAIAELDRIIASEREAGQEVATFRILRAGLQFDQGQTGDAIDALRALLEEEGLAPGTAGNARVALARMLIVQGDSAAARELVEQAVAEDTGQIEALKMLAAWLIEEDRADVAISRLRTALDLEPDDTEALTLMADAHARNGNRDLSRDFLSRAVEASGAAPAETIRYARVLLEDDRGLFAEELVIDALRGAPGNPELLVLLGDIYLRMEDWSRAEQVERTLRNGDAASVALADRLRTAILAAQGQTEAALAYLEALATSGEGGDLGTRIAVIRARLATGDAAGALSYVRDLLADDPDNVALRMALAAVHTGSQQYSEAEAVYRDLAAEVPELQEAWIGLIRSLTVQGRAEEARATLEEALTVLPDAPDLLWAQASFREQLGDFEGAIALYERLYAMLPNQPVVANNLASLISTYRDDEASLDRAYTIARRLRGTDVPPFQDTYGWIAYRKGEYQEALEHLEPAAAALANDPLVQYHLGMTYLALGRQDAALDQLRRAVELAGADDSRPQFDTARSEIAALEAAEDTGPEDTGPEDTGAEPAAPPD
ncbi:MAG: tetratricopeptide repeat protein, partial [Paracoccaceae bacterium]|nr:tetratricopeptide repeat protein [Paracoccaceae bacterium]